MAQFLQYYRRAKALYRNQRKAIVWVISVIMVVVVYGNSVVALPSNMLPALAVIVALILIDTLSEIDENTRPHSRIPLYRDFDGAVERLRILLADITEECEVIVLGADGGATFHRLLPVLKNCRSSKISFKIFVVDVQDGPISWLQKKWKVTLPVNLESIQSKLAERRHNLEVFVYPHLPVLGGVLLDRRHLFLGCHRWQGDSQKELESADCEHIYFDRNAGGVGEYFCSLMEDWTLHNPTCKQIFPPPSAGQQVVSADASSCYDD